MKTLKNQLKQFTPSLFGKPASEPWMLTLSSISRTRHEMSIWTVSKQRTAPRSKTLFLPCALNSEGLLTHMTLAWLGPLERCSIWPQRCWRDDVHECFCNPTGGIRRPDALVQTLPARFFLICHINHAMNTHSIVISWVWKRSCDRGTEDVIYLLDP